MNLPTAKVLIVDDEPIARKSLRLLLSSCGFEVQTAGSAADANKIGASFCPDLLIVDYTLDGRTTGIDIALSMQSGRSTALPTIVITGNPTSEIRSLASELPIARLLSKPSSADQLIAVARQLTTV